MRFSEFHRRRELVVSFELFPPKTPEAHIRLFQDELPALLRLSPAFLTCTYGAGGSTREQTLEVVGGIARDFGVEIASHLTCVGSSRRQIDAYLQEAASLGVANIVALRGDPPRGDAGFRPEPGGFQRAAELVVHIRRCGGFDVAVAGYPEGHPECPDRTEDWRHCAEKVAAGADVVITQLFYDLEDFWAFEDFLRNRMEVRVPIVAGVLPILSAQQISRFCSLCGARIPPPVQARLEQYADDPASCRRYGVELATQMCAELIARKAAGIHFYTLNRAASTAEVMRNLGLCPGGT